MAEPVETEEATKVSKSNQRQDAFTLEWPTWLSTGEEVAAAAPQRATMLFGGELPE
ncbi:hypothetical protein SESBI_07600 [Sesbania bispinosa]|nr:hypothetical protein SESBI_07600 [Sesbania bispinosa]